MSAPLELHAIALYQRSGEELLMAAEKDEPLRTRVTSILSDRLLAQRLQQVEQALSIALASEADRVVIDLRGLEFMDSTGLRVIASACTGAVTRGLRNSNTSSSAGSVWMISSM